MKTEQIILDDVVEHSEVIKYNSKQLHSAIGNKTPNKVYDEVMHKIESANQELLEVA